MGVIYKERPMRYIAILPILLCGCASMINGSSQQLVIQTVPFGATCELVRNGSSIGAVVKTPGTITVSRSSYPLIVICNKEGYVTSTYTLEAKEDFSVMGSALTGGYIGYRIDKDHGANYAYKEESTIILNKK